MPQLADTYLSAGTDIGIQCCYWLIFHSLDFNCTISQFQHQHASCSLLRLQVSHKPNVVNFNIATDIWYCNLQLNTVIYTAQNIRNLNVKIKIYKQLSFRRETAQHSRSFEMTLLIRVLDPISISLQLCLQLARFLRYSVSKNSLTLKLGIGVIQGNWKWLRLIDHIRLSIGRPL